MNHRLELLHGHLDHPGNSPKFAAMSRGLEHIQNTSGLSRKVLRGRSNRIHNYNSKRHKSGLGFAV